MGGPFSSARAGVTAVLRADRIERRRRNVGPRTQPPTAPCRTCNCQTLVLYSLCCRNVCPCSPADTRISQALDSGSRIAVGTGVSSCKVLEPQPYLTEPRLEGLQSGTIRAR